MTSTSLQNKQSYYAKVRQSNYAASLRLSGFDVSQDDAVRPLPSLQTTLEAFRKPPSDTR